MKRFIKRAFLLTLLIGTFFLVSGFGSLYLMQDSIIFFPDKYYQSPAEIGMPEFEEITYKTKTLSNGFGWYFKGDTKKPAILYFHGNKGQVSLFAPLLKPYLKLNYPVFIVEYQGFGKLPGKPNEKALIEDGIAAFDFLKEQGHQKIILHGFSLGTGVALGVSEKRQSSAVILEAPFFSLYRLADETIPFSQYFLKNKFFSNERITKVNVPLLIIHGTGDQVIPFQHGKDLYELASEKDKSFISLPNATHHVFEFGSYSKIQDWLQNRFKQSS